MSAPRARATPILFALFHLLVVLATPAASSPPVSAEDQALARALKSAKRCHLISILTGPAHPCEVLPPPDRYAELFEDLLSLSFGNGAAPQVGLDDWGMLHPLLCQYSIDSAVLDGAAKRILSRRAPSRVGSRRRGHPIAGGVERLCRVRVAETAGGLVLPSVGPQCAAAIGDAGEGVDAGALARCLDSLLDTWIERALSPSRALRPNIIVILADDQRFDSIDATHSPAPELGLPAMPAVIERLADQGVTFTRAFASLPVCAPSRASFFTGQYAFHHGTVFNTGPRGGAGFDDSSTLATWLRDAGYRTGFYGKYINDYTAKWDPEVEAPYLPDGWDDFRAFNEPDSIDHTSFTMVENGEIVAYGEETPAYSTDVMASQAISFIEESANSDQPFLVYFSTATPHYPWTPAPRHEGAFDQAAPWAPPSYLEADVSDKPLWVRNLPEPNIFLDLGIQWQRRAQLSMQLATDEFVDDLMDRLEDLGIDEDTIVIYTSDNGHAWGEHRWYGKGCAYEECARIPLVVRYPRLAPLPRVEDGLALNIDLAPTLAELAGIPVPPERDGRSLVRTLDGTARDAREDVYLEFAAFAGAFPYRALRDERWKLVEYKNGDLELYDLETDPHELENVSSDPANLQRILSMRGRISQLRASASR